MWPRPFNIETWTATFGEIDPSDHRQIGGIILSAYGAKDIERCRPALSLPGEAHALAAPFQGNGVEVIQYRNLDRNLWKN